IRNNADALGGDENIIYLGDMNFGSSGEQGYANYRASGPAQAFDPLNLLTWPNFSIPQHMTQSTRVSSLPDGGAPSGMDDRFDLQIVTEELLDGEGLSYIGPTSSGLSSLDHSYQAFGNDGVSLNSNINNTTVGRSQSAAVLDALFEFSDHLPVVADYQLPAVLDVLTGSVPTTLQEGELFELEVMVSNAADVVAAVGADELDYTLSVNGDLAGSGGGTQAALASAATHFVTLDTSTPGLKSGVLTVSTTSQAAANSLVEIPISFEVLAGGPNGDFNGDGMVDAEDYVVFRDGLSPNGLASGDYDEFVENFGSGGTLSVVAASTVPEPSAGALLLLAACGGMVCRRR
ncbi:MAG: PEP-CTERM sorting domain-containing protein, partial [Planctomycetota bacterium]